MLKVAHLVLSLTIMQGLESLTTNKVNFMGQGYRKAFTGHKVEGIMPRESDTISLNSCVNWLLH